MQRSLFDGGVPGFDPGMSRLVRRPLDGSAWVDYLPNWLMGHEAVYGELVRDAHWRHHRRVMYERIVDVPRLTANGPAHAPVAALLEDMSETLSRRYGLELDQITLALYRDGADSVAPHGDKMGRLVDDTVVAIVSVGAPRRFLLQPAGGGSSITFSLGWGDLLVMGGACQRTWRHGVPKVPHADPRISIMLREAALPASTLPETRFSRELRA